VIFPIIFCLAVAFNYAWELAQLEFYANTGGLSAMWWHCFKSSIVDSILVLAIFGIGALIFKDRSWFQRVTIGKCLFIVVVGLTVGIGVEWIGLQLLRRWEYSPSMPMIPMVNVGVVPVLQMVILPPMIFWIGKIIQTKFELKRKSQP